jgi:hypothetical protein
VADLHILREHTLGFSAARKIAFQWAEQAEGEFGMACTHEEGVAVFAPLTVIPGLTRGSMTSEPRPARSAWGRPS